MTEQGVARQLAELLVFERDVAQRSQTGVDAIGAFAAGDDALDDGLGILDPRPGLGRQLQLCAMASDCDHILPAQRGVGDNDSFNLGHLQPRAYNLNIDAASLTPSRARPLPH
ncbi:hypothetical protein D3C86_1857810 [compost metagenome]